MGAVIGYDALSVFSNQDDSVELNTTLLREKFTISDNLDDLSMPVVATSNRIPLMLLDASGQVSETFIIRAQNMHTTIRMAAQILQTFMRMGPLMARAEAYNFDEALVRILSDHESNYNPHRWVAVYNKGKIVFSVGEYHAFLDVIEKCDSINPGNYDRSVGIAEETFRKMGKDFSIQHESNIGMVIHVKPEIGRCGLVLRNPHKSTTFNFIAETKEEGTNVPPLTCLNACAAFLEGVQLAVRIGMVNEKLRLKKIEKFSAEVKDAQSALRRMAQLNVSVGEMENRFRVHYRPEKPEFSAIVKEAEIFQRKLLNR